MTIPSCRVQIIESVGDRRTSVSWTFPKEGKVESLVTRIGTYWKLEDTDDLRMIRSLFAVRHWDQCELTFASSLSKKFGIKLSDHPTNKVLILPEEVRKTVQLKAKIEAKKKGSSRSMIDEILSKEQQTMLTPVSESLLNSNFLEVSFHFPIGKRSFFWGELLTRISLDPQEESIYTFTKVKQQNSI